jgi:hypothetical protein
VIELIAAAMAEGTNGGDWANRDQYKEEHKKIWLKRADIALHAMLNPTPEMLKVGNAAMLGMVATAETGWQDALRVGWQAMVLKAMEE